MDEGKKKDKIQYHPAYSNAMRLELYEDRELLKDPKSRRICRENTGIGMAQSQAGDRGILQDQWRSEDRERRRYGWIL